MSIISARKRLWIEIPELDLADLLVFSDYATSTNIAFTAEASDTLVFSDELVVAYFDEASDTLIYSDTISASDLSAPLLADTIIISDVIEGEALPFGDVRETLYFSDAIAYTQGSFNSDIVVISDTLTSKLVSTKAVSDTITISDLIGSHIQGLHSETLIYSDSPATLLSQYTDSTDQVIIVDSALSRAAITASFSDSLVYSDTIGYGFIGASVDTLTLSDAISGNVVLSTPVLSDTLIISEALAGPISAYATVLSDSVVASDLLSGSLALVGVLSDTVLFGDTLSDASYQTIIVANAETGAVSTYTMTPVVAGLAEYRGTLYLAGPDGLYAMDATEDEDGEVVWTLRTGFSNLGNDLLKRVRDANILGRTEGNTLFKVVTARNGEKQEYAYQLPEATRDAYRDGVTKVGRGLQSVYWQFEMEGTGPAEIDQIKLAIEPLSRRR